MGKKTKTKNPAQLRGKLDIGNPDALYDNAYLENCFIETNISGVLMDDHNIRSLLVGRTGTGKTACIRRIVHLSESKNLKYVEIQVEHEFLGYLKNLMWLKQLADGKYNLIPLFKNLWKHIIVVSLIKKEFSSQQNFLERTTRFFSKKKNVAARLREYVDSYGGDFWESAHTLEKVVQSCTRKISGELDLLICSASCAYESGVATTADDSHGIGEKSTEIQDAITNRKLMDELQYAIAHISEYIHREVGRGYYVLIDKLDEEWIDDSIRYQLIRALIEVIRDFYSNNNEDGYPIKVVVALRRDLLDKVYEITRSAGFQSEKHRAFESKLQWSPNELRQLIETRIKYMHKHKGTSVEFSDIFPPKIEKMPTVKYMIERTLQRPRDMISFVNCCLQEWSGKPLTRAMFVRAEREYSNIMFGAIIDEWKGFYPKLDVYAEILAHQEFQSGSVDFTVWKKMVSYVVINAKSEGDVHLDRWIDGVETKLHDVAVEFLDILYCTGLVQIKPKATSGFMVYPHKISAGQYKKEMLIKIHPMLYEKLGIRQQKPRS